MNRYWPMLCVFLLTGCAQRSEVEDAPPKQADTNFDRLPMLLADIQTKEVLLYEGLPSQFWEPRLREEQLRENQTVEIHGHPFYDDVLTLDKDACEQLTAIFITPNSFEKYRVDKQCSGYHPDFCLEWSSSGASTQCLISLECGEVEIFGPKGEMHCDFSQKAGQNLRQLLWRHTKNRPKSDTNPSIPQSDE